MFAHKVIKPAVNSWGGRTAGTAGLRIKGMSRRVSTAAPALWHSEKYGVGGGESGGREGAAKGYQQVKPRK